MIGHFSFLKSTYPAYNPMPPSIEFTKRGGYKDLRQPEDDGWFQEQIPIDSTMILSLLERRWLSQNFDQFNRIDGRFIVSEDVPVKIGAGGFGDVEKVTYKRPGAPRMAPFYALPNRFSIPHCPQTYL